MQDHHQSLGFAQVNVQFPEHEQLRCPRCDSNNTKFCYYNNYNLSQPRHFCKSCKRYWTKGGTLRNIPVGGGCRKSSKRPAATAASKQQQQRVVQNPSASITTVPSSGSGSATFLNQNQSQNPSLKAEPGPIPTPTPGVGPGSDGSGPGLGPGESFTSLLGLASKGQFGNFIEGFCHSGPKLGPGQDSGLDLVQGSGSSSEGFLLSEANCWASYNNAWPDLVINTNPGSKLQ
ncbi:hypothetical protein RND81_14G148900 [Saponaria officinalis]|uniref:Dof zinc finger protein n=1 Tax=Saponaria officinalis TaxID=3572 RepID=A0AAW1GM94_SAPOF